MNWKVGDVVLDEEYDDIELIVDKIHSFNTSFSIRYITREFRYCLYTDFFQEDE